MITFARNIYVPQIEKSDEKIGFLMMDIDKTGMEKSYRQERIEM